MYHILDIKFYYTNIINESIAEDAACLLRDNTLKTAGNKEQDGYEPSTTVKSLLEDTFWTQSCEMMMILNPHVPESSPSHLQICNTQHLSTPATFSTPFQFVFVIISKLLLKKTIFSKMWLEES